MPRKKSKRTARPKSASATGGRSSKKGTKKSPRTGSKSTLKSKSKVSAGGRTRSATSSNSTSSKSTKKSTSKSRPFKSRGKVTRRKRSSEIVTPKIREPNQTSGEGIRLQKFLAQAGHGSRRECEELIVQGRVTIDGKLINQLGARVDPQSLKVRVDGTKIKPVRLQYFMLNKPPGVLSTCSDPDGRMRVIDLIQTDQRVYNVGRLDKSSEGLILVTNDGDLANRITHPRYGVAKTYHVVVVGSPRREDLELLKRGIRLAEAVAQVSEVKVKKRRKDTSELIIVLNEGRNREIRRLLAHIGHKVTHLRRIAIGPLQLGDLSPGRHRRLEQSEIDALTKASSIVRGKQPRSDRPVETSMVGRRRRKAAAEAEEAGKTSGKKTADATTKGKKTVGKKGSAASSGKATVGSKTGTKKKSGSGLKRVTDSRRVGGIGLKRTPSGKKKTSRKKTTRSKVTSSTSSRRGAGRSKLVRKKRGR